MPDTRTRAQRIRAEKQEKLREFLSNQKLIEHVIDLSQKIEDLGATQEAIEAIQQDDPDRAIVDIINALAGKAEFDLKKFRASAEIRLKLINKYLPDMRYVESDNTHSLDDETVTKIVRTIVDPDQKHS